MKINVKAKTGARKEKVEEISGGDLVVAVKARPTGGQANIAIMDALAEYFKVSKTSVRLVSGFSSKQKVFEIS